MWIYLKQEKRKKLKKWILHGRLYRSKHLKHRKAEKKRSSQGGIFELDKDATNVHMWSQKKSHLVLSKQQQNSLTWKLRQQIDLESRSNVGDSPNRHLGEGRKPRTPISSSIQNVNHPSFIRILYILSISFEGEWTQKLGSFSILGPVFRAHFQTLGINQWDYESA